MVNPSCNLPVATHMIGKYQKMTDAMHKLTIETLRVSFLSIKKGICCAIDRQLQFCQVWFIQKDILISVRSYQKCTSF